MDEPASPQLSARASYRTHQGQSPRSGYPGGESEPGVHVADVPRLWPPRFSTFAGGFRERRVLGDGVPSGHQRGRQTTSGGQQDRVAILRRSTSPAALIRGGESLPWKPAGDDSARDGSACDSTTGHREATRGPPDRQPLRRTVPKPPRRASLPL